MSLRQTHYPLLSTGSTQDDGKSSRHYRKIDDLDVKHQNKETKQSLSTIGYMHV